MQKRARSPPAQTSEGDVMKTLIRVVKRGSQNDRDDDAAAAQAKPRVTTEMIVKNWIIESREQRRTAAKISLLGGQVVQSLVDDRR